MKKFQHWLPLLGGGVVVLLLAALLLVPPALAQGPGGMMGGGRGPGWMHGYTQGVTGTVPYGPGWMMGGGPGWMMGPGGIMGGGPGWMMGPGMMGFTQGLTDSIPFGFGPGWMMRNSPGFTDSIPYGPGGMMGGMMMNSNSPFFNVEPLTLDEANAVLDAYLADLGEDNLEVAEVMVFENHAYAQIVESDTGIGVMEVLVDPTTRAVFPEMGPNMMWNLKYGMMSGYGRYGMGMMMGRFGFNGPGGQAELSAEMPIGPQEAVETAQAYLDSTFPHLAAGDEAEPFYGYYTLHVLEDGQEAGMLSVNGYSGQVFPHTWHGELLEMSEAGN